MKPLSLPKLAVVAAGALIAFVAGGVLLHLGRPSAAVLPLAGSGVHSHNDYAQPVPLTAALDAGVASVEVDVHLLNDRLVIGLDKDSLNAERTLVLEYLEPLRQRINANRDKWIYPGQPGRTLVLLVDIKSEAKPTLERLRQELKDYADLLTTFDASYKIRPLTVIITGQRDKQGFAAGPRNVFGDSQLNEPDTPYQIYPLVSDAWSNQFKWDGTGTMPADEVAKLKQYVTAAHRERRLVRFWNAPDTADCWRAQRDAGVDLIHSNKPSEAVNALK